MAYDKNTEIEKSQTIEQKSFEIALSEWAETSVIHKDNVRLNHSRYIPEYLGMLKTIDALCWRSDIEQFNLAKTILDAIKIKYFPGWLLRKFPAKIRSVDIRIIYPGVSKFPDRIGLKDFEKTKKFLVCTTKESVYGIDSF